MDNEKYNVSTSVGKFKVEKTKTHLYVGGKKFCVMIKFYDSEMPEAAELQWVTSHSEVTVAEPLITKDGGCELEDKLIQGDSTVHLLKLSLTLLKLYRDVKVVTLLDNSKYDCTFADKSKIAIYINKYNYLFYGGTWYDKKVNAIPIKISEQISYEKTKPLYTDPSVKPPSFNFENPILQKELTPIYESTKTWKEFADLLHSSYNKETLCQKISPWYIRAVSILTDRNSFPEYWKIDITNINIPFTRIMSGGKRSTRKGKYILPNQEHFIMSPHELYNKIL